LKWSKSKTNKCNNFFQSKRKDEELQNPGKKINFNY